MYGASNVEAYLAYGKQAAVGICRMTQGTDTGPVTT